MIGGQQCLSAAPLISFRSANFSFLHLYLPKNADMTLPSLHWSEKAVLTSDSVCKSCQSEHKQLNQCINCSIINSPLFDGSHREPAAHSIGVPMMHFATDLVLHESAMKLLVPEMTIQICNIRVGNSNTGVLY